MRTPCRNKKRRAWLPSFLFGGITNYLEESDNQEWAFQEIQRRADMMIPETSTAGPLVNQDHDDALVFRRCIRQLLRTYEWNNAEVEKIFVALCQLGTNVPRYRCLVLLLMQYFMDTYPHRQSYILACHFLLSTIHDPRSIALMGRVDAFDFPTGEQIRSWLYRSPQHAKAVLVRCNPCVESADLVRLVTWGNVVPGAPRDGCLEALALVALRVRIAEMKEDEVSLWNLLLQLWDVLTWWPRIVMIRNAPALPKLWKLGWDCDQVVKFETARCILRHNEQSIINNFWASRAVSWLRDGRLMHGLKVADSLVVAETVDSATSLLPLGASLRPGLGDSWMEPLSE